MNWTTKQLAHTIHKTGIKMATVRLLLTSLALLWSLSAFANGACEKLPKEVEDFLRSEPEWTILQSKDLLESDKALWDQFHSGLCPGIAVVDLDGKGKRSYALAMLHREKGRVREKLVVVATGNGRLDARVLVRPTNIMYTTVAAPFVVWRTPPGIYRDLKSGRQVKISRDAIVYEKMEATATLYYLVDKQFKSILTSE